MTIWDALADGADWVLATVVRQLRSAPLTAGSMMAVGRDGRVLGDVSGGCVDAEVHALASECLDSGRTEFALFGVSDERALRAGLTCGGAIEVVVRPAPEPRLAERIATEIAADRPVALVTALDSGISPDRHLVVLTAEVLGTLGDPDVDRAATAAARAARSDAADAEPAVRELRGRSLIMQWFLPRPRLLVFGAVAHTESLAVLGRMLGYRVTVCDARPVFATRERVPSADEVVVDWPHRFLETLEVDRRTVIVSLVHDEKFEIPLLVAGLHGPAGYVGALGSRRTQRRRLELLRAAGVGEHELLRLHAPIGLDLGARTAAETAVSIMAEVIATASGRSGRPLAELSGSLHPGRRA